MSDLLILGAGGHGKVVADVAMQMGKWKSVAFLDDRQGLKSVTGYPVIGNLNDFALVQENFQYAFVGIGNGELRLEWLRTLLDVGFEVPTLIHPFTAISKHSFIGIGTVVMAGVVINASTKIGEGCILNTSSTVDHDCVLGDGVHLSPGVHLSGTVHIGRSSWLCTGSNVSNNLNIGKNVVVAAGATVIDSIPDNVMVAGVPAKIKKYLGMNE